MLEVPKTEVDGRGASWPPSTIGDDEKKSQYENQITMLLSSVDIGCDELRMQDDESVATGRTSRVGRVEESVEGSLMSGGDVGVVPSS